MMKTVSSASWSTRHFRKPVLLTTIGLLMGLMGHMLVQGSVTQAAELPPDMQRINDLVANNRYAEAYELAVPMVKEHEGEPEFDFLYGLSALETGHPNEAVFALERITYTYPDQLRVKLELARAFYLISNYKSSRQLFNEVLDTNPSDNVKANIKVFLDLITERENDIAGSFDWSISTSFGSDSNINSATDLGVISLPIGNVQLSGNGRRIEDSFADIALAASYNKPFSKTTALTVTGNFSHHDNFDSNDFDLDVFSGDVGYSSTTDDIRMSYDLRGQRINLNSSHFQDSTSAIVTMQRSPGDGWIQALTGAYSLIRYDDSINKSASLRDVNQLLASGVLGRTVGQFTTSVTVYYGDEHAKESAGTDNAQQFYGLAVAEQYQLNATNFPYFRLAMHHADNKATNVLFGVERSDKMLSTSLGWMWLAKRNINVTADLTYTDNASNIPLFEYDRLKFQTGLRYQF